MNGTVTRHADHLARILRAQATLYEGVRGPGSQGVKVEGSFKSGHHQYRAARFSHTAQAWMAPGGSHRDLRV